jgi:hypothetical protein
MGPGTGVNAVSYFYAGFFGPFFLPGAQWQTTGSAWAKTPCGPKGDKSTRYFRRLHMDMGVRLTACRVYSPGRQAARLALPGVVPKQRG